MGFELWAARGFPSKPLHPPASLLVQYHSLLIGTSGKPPSRAPGLFGGDLLLALDPGGSGVFKHPAISFKGWVGGLHQDLWLSAQGKSRRRRL